MLPENIKIFDSNKYKNPGPVKEKISEFTKNYNNLADKWSALLKQYPQHRDLVAPSIEAFSSIGKKINKTHLNIGLIGRSGVGKSYHINRLFLPDADPLGFGSGNLADTLYAKVKDSGGATSAAIVKLTTGKRSNPCKITAFNKTQLEGKKKALKDVIISDLKIQDALNCSGEEFKKRIEERISQQASDGIVSQYWKTFQFLEGETNNDQDSVPRECAFAELALYANHGDTRSARVFQIEAPVVEHGLSEIISIADMPGAGAKEIDNFITGEFLHELDGVILFLLPGEVDDLGSENQVKEFKKNFGESFESNRTLLIFPKLGILNPNLSKVQKSWHDKIQKYVGDNRDFVFFTDTEVWGPPDNPMRKPLGELMRYYPGEHIKNYFPDFLDYFEKTLSNGGIDALRDFLNKEWPEKILTQMLRQGNFLIEKSEKDYLEKLKVIELKESIGYPEREKFAQAILIMQELKDKIRRQYPPVIKSFATLKNQLKISDKNLQVMSSLIDTPFSKFIDQIAVTINTELNDKIYHNFVAMIVDPIFSQLEKDVSDLEIRNVFIENDDAGKAIGPLIKLSQLIRMSRPIDEAKLKQMDPEGKRKLNTPNIVKAIIKPELYAELEKFGFNDHTAGTEFLRKTLENAQKNGSDSQDYRQAVLLKRQEACHIQCRNIYYAVIKYTSDFLSAQIETISKIIKSQN